jgi:hypothetical protein
MVGNGLICSDIQQNPCCLNEKQMREDEVFPYGINQKDVCT